MSRINLPKKQSKSGDFASEMKKRRAKWYNRKDWRLLRQEILEERVFCEDCAKQGLLNDKDLECHHVKSPFTWGLLESEREQLFTDKDNIVLLCKRCHALRHNRGKDSKNGSTDGFGESSEG